MVRRIKLVLRTRIIVFNRLVSCVAFTHLFTNLDQLLPLYSRQKVQHKLRIKFHFLLNHFQVTELERKGVTGFGACADSALNKVGSKEFHCVEEMCVCVC